MGKAENRWRWTTAPATVWNWQTFVHGSGFSAQAFGAPWVADEADDEPFQFLGLSGSIEVALDPATRMPLTISGTAPYVGRVTFRLRAATLE